VKVLVTGGTGVVGHAAITELLQRGHEVRLLSRGARDDARAWAGPVEPFPGDVGDANAIRGAATGCDAVLHIAGIVEESGPDATFERINVTGTANVIGEAARAGVTRLIFVSSLGAHRGESAYHRSKLEAESLVRQFDGEWSIVRTGAVIGPGDETVSILLRMMRMLPAVPVIGNAEQPFQPVWHEDVGWALAEAVDRADLHGSVLNIAGPEIITVGELIDTLEDITDRHPLRIPLPSFVARAGSMLAEAIGIDTPVTAATIDMLLEGNYLREGEINDLTERLQRSTAPLRDRLIQLADDLPEQTPDQGVGKLQRRRFSIDFHTAGRTATAIARQLRDEFSDIMPFETAAEPGSATCLDEGCTLTLELPVRGHVQVRVEDVHDHGFTLATLEGHPLAGIVRFRLRDLDDGAVRLTIDVLERPASRLDQLSMALVGSAAQKRTWMQAADNLVAAAHGTARDGVDEESWEIDDDDAEPLEDWVQALVDRRQRNAMNPP
jgi:uncharacterized protein YbjT (DUF2867 family)